VATAESNSELTPGRFHSSVLELRIWFTTNIFVDALENSSKVNSRC